MKKFVQYIMLFSAFACITGCVTALNSGLWPIKKGLPRDEVIKLLDDNKGSSVIKIKEKEVHVVPISLAVADTFSIVIAKKNMVLERQFCVFAFKNSRLFYWGTLVEFARHDSPLINELGEQSAKILAEY